MSDPGEQPVEPAAAEATAAAEAAAEASTTENAAAPEPAPAADPLAELMASPLPGVPEIRELVRELPQVDEEDVVCRAFWAAIQPPNNTSGDAGPDGFEADALRSSYAMFIKQLLRFSGCSDAASAILSRRVMHHDCLGNAGPAYAAFRRRLAASVGAMFAGNGGTAEKLRALAGLFLADDGQLKGGGPPPAGAAVPWDTRSLAPTCPVVQHASTSADNQFVVVGDPCVGKSTFGAGLANDLGAVHLDVVQLLVAEIERDSEFGRALRWHLEHERPIPVEKQAELIRAELGRPQVQHKGFVFDEFPALPASAYGDEEQRKWLQWCGVGGLARQVVALRCSDSIRPGDEWNRRFEASRAEWRDRTAAEMRQRTAEDARQAEKDRKAAEKQKPAAGGGDEEDPPPAEEDEEEEDEDERKDRLQKEADAATAAAERRLTFDAALCVRMGRAAWFAGQACPWRDASGQQPQQDQDQPAPDASGEKQEESQPVNETDGEAPPPCEEWEGDVPFLSPINHPEIGALVLNASTRGTFVAISCLEPVDRNLVTVHTLLNGLHRAGVPEAVSIPTPSVEESGDVESLEAEHLAPLLEAAPLHPTWGKTCPVTYAEDGVVAEGLYYLPATAAGRTYLFASPDRRARFVSNPATFLGEHPRAQDGPILLISKTKTGLEQLGLSSKQAADTFGEHLVQRMGYTLMDLRTYSESWKEVREKTAVREAEEKRRKTLLEKRAKELEKASRKEPKGGKKKKADAKKKKDGDEPAPEASPDPAALPDAADKEEEAPPPEPTMQEKKHAEIAKLRSLKEVQPRVLLLVDPPSVREAKESVEYLLAENVMPNIIVSLVVKPSTGKRTSAEEDPLAAYAEEEDEEEEDQDEPADGDENDEDKPKEPKASATQAPPSEVTDAEYRKLAAGIVSMATKHDEESAAPPRKLVKLKCDPPSTYDALVWCLQRACDRFTETPAATDEPPPQEDGAEEENEDEEAGGPAPEERALQKLLRPRKPALAQYGACLRYCPVTLVTKRLLVRGDEECAALYGNRRWTFRGRRERAAFVARPEAFGGGPAFAPEPPPPALWLVGNRASHAEALAAAWAAEFAVSVVSFDELPSIAEAAATAAPDCPRVKQAAMVSKQLKKAEAEQEKRRALREAKAAAGDEDDEGLESEDEETKTERIVKGKVKILSHLIRVEPYATGGYLLTDVPAKEEHLDMMVAADVIPEAVVCLPVEKDTYVRRRLPFELKRQTDAANEKRDVLKAKRKEAEARRKAREIERWRRRNLQDDDPGDEDDADDEEDPPVPSAEDIEEELGAAFELEAADLQTITEKATSLQIPVHQVPSDPSPEVTLSVASLHLRPILTYRTSLFQVPYPVTLSDAERALRDHTLRFSPFRLADPVLQYEKAKGNPPKFVQKPPKRKAFHERSRGEGASSAEDLAAEKKLKDLRTDENLDREEPEEEEEEEAEDEDPAAGEEGDGGEADDAKTRPDSGASAARTFGGGASVFVALAGELFMFKSREHAAAFLAHPSRYSSQRPALPASLSADPYSALQNNQIPLATHEPPLITLLLTPAAAGGGARSLGDTLAAGLSAVHVTREKAVKHVLRTESALAEQTLALVKNREPFDAPMLARIVAARVQHPDVQCSGCVLENVVTSRPQAIALDQALSKLGSLHRVICLRDPGAEDAEYAQRDMVDAVEFFAETYSNVEYLTAEEGAFTHLASSIACVQTAEKSRENVCRSRFTGKPCVLTDAGQPLRSMLERLSSFRQFDSFEWSVNRELHLCDLTTTITSKSAKASSVAAEYLGQVYLFRSPEAVAHFLANPDSYHSPAEDARLPADLPSLIDPTRAQAVFDGQWQLSGFCPVTLFNTRTRIGLKHETQPLAVWGKAECGVSYKGEFYRMVDEEARSLFLRRPWVYSEGAALPTRLPIAKALLKSQKEVPFDDYIKETLYEAVARATLAVGESRPVYPGCSTKASALRFVAAHLKANNPSNSELKSRVYKKNFADYVKACSLADFFLSDAAAAAEPAVRDKNAKLWDSIAQKKLDPSTYEQLHLE